MHTMLAPRMTADEYLALEDGYRNVELIEGEIVVDEPKAPHQLVVRQALRALDRWALSADGRGEVMLPLDVKLDERNVFAPDVLWYAERRALEAGRPYPIPDLVVEVRSPSTWRYDRGTKLLAYERAGLAELWLVDNIAEAVLVFRRSASDMRTFDVAVALGVDEVLTSPQLPGFALGVASLFDG